MAPRKPKPKPTGGSASSKFLGGTPPTADETSTTTTKTKHAIGVPDDYEVNVRGPLPPGVHGGFVKSQLITHGAQYFKGDEWAKAPSNPQDIADLQRYLVDAGLLDEKSGTVLGQWDDKSAAALVKLMATANQSGTSWEDTLGARLSAVAQGAALEKGGSGSGVSRAPLTTHLTNPIDLADVARSVAKSLYAGDLSPDELNQFVSSYQSAEAGYQQQAYGMADSGGTITEPASASASAEDFLRKNHGDQVNASQFGDTLDTYLRLIKSGG